MSNFIFFDFGGDLAPLVLRLALGILFLIHGFQLFGMWRAQSSEQTPATLLFILRILSITEPLGAVAVIFGFLNQLAVMGLAVIMVGAIIFKIKIRKITFIENNKTGWELDFIILAACLALFLLGPGIISLDYLFFGF